MVTSVIAGERSERSNLTVKCETASADKDHSSGKVRPPRSDMVWGVSLVRAGLQPRRSFLLFPQRLNDLFDLLLVQRLIFRGFAHEFFEVFQSQGGMGRVLDL
jgi:hypothetical protein